jgi:hypothetical protein
MIPNGGRLSFMRPHDDSAALEREGQREKRKKKSVFIGSRKRWLYGDGHHDQDHGFGEHKQETRPPAGVVWFSFCWLAALS